MDLPQTAPGVPAAGIDPTPEELPAITTLGHVLDWLGASTELRDALVLALGGGAPRLRGVLYIPGPTWSSMAASISVPTGTSSTPTSVRSLSPVEQGHVAMVRRIVRLRLGMPAVEVLAPAPTTGPPSSGTSGTAGPAPTGPAPSATNTTAAACEPRVKLSVLIDPSLDTELQRLPQAKITALFAAYEAKRGAEPAEDIEPTTEQISALHQILVADITPYADFAIFGRHGRRMLQKLTFLAWAHQPDGTWQRRDLPGPPSFDHWWASFRVLRTTFLLLDAVAPENLDNYGELIRGYNTQYGQAVWFIVYMADVRMRSERFQRLRRQAERDHQAAVRENRATHFDPAKPWDTVFALALADKTWWEENLHRAVLLYMSRVRTASQILDDHTAQPSIDQPGHRTAATTLLRPPPGDFGGGRQRSRTPPRAPRDRPKTPPRRTQEEDSGEPVFTKKGRRFCDQYNTKAGCPAGQRCALMHACKKCKRVGHPAYRCDPARRGGRDEGARGSR